MSLICLKSKGVSEVVASILLVSIAVGATGTFYVVQEDLRGDVQQEFKSVTEVDLGDSLRVDQCYQEGAYTFVVLRNTNEEALNVSQINTYIEDRPQSVQVNQEVVDPQRTFSVNLTENISRSNSEVRFVGAESQKTHICDIQFRDEFTDEPEALFNINNSIPEPGDTIEFDASPSEYLTGSITSYDWDFGDDGSFYDSGLMVEKTYTSTGTKQVRLNITTNDGKEDSALRAFEVQTDPCSGNSDPDSDLVFADQTGLEVTMDASGSSDPEGQSMAYRWDWNNDGTYSSGDAVEDHTYSSEGTYNIRVNVSDPCGGFDISNRTLTVEVNEPIWEVGDNITYLEFDATGDTSILPYTAVGSDTVCLGSGCGYSKAVDDTDFDTDKYVNVTGDKMSGPLGTENVSYQSSICLGINCNNATGTRNRDWLLRKDNMTMDGPIYTQAITSDGNMCIGNTTKC